MKKLYRLAFFVPPRRDHQLFWHQLRDGTAFAYLREALLEANVECTFAGVVRNVPDAPLPSQFTSDDLIVATTRFPLDDEEGEDDRRVVPGDNDLERQFGISRTLAPDGVGCKFFTRLNRSFAVLSVSARRLLRKQFENRDDIRLSNSRGARCIQFRRRRDTKLQRTVAYLINVPYAWPDGPGFVWSFGVSGEAGLIWNKILCAEYARMLKQPHFGIAEFDVPHLAVPKSVVGDDDIYGPGTLDWATSDTLNLELAADRELTREDLESLGLPS